MNRPRGKRVTPLTPGKVSKVTKAGRYADGGGLYLWVKPDGRKTWTFRWRDRLTGKLREAGLGSLTNERVTLKMARKRADNYRDQVWNGLDPIKEKAQAASPKWTVRRVCQPLTKNPKVHGIQGIHCSLPTCPALISVTKCPVRPKAIPAKAAPA